MEHQITLDEYMSMKNDIKEKLKGIADNFVFIGYRLKQIRDRELYLQDGCQDINEFALKEFNLTKSSVSRFIAINSKYSVGGDSEELKEEYKEYGSSKLSEMLTLSDAECQLITQRTPIKDIRMLKQFNVEEHSKEVIEQKLTPIQKAIEFLFLPSEQKGTLERIFQLVSQDSTSNIEEIIAEINPSGYKTVKKGIALVFLYDQDTGVKYKLMGEEQPHEITWSEFINEIIEIYGTYHDTESSIWENYYGKLPEKKIEEKPKKEDVATSQQTRINTPSKPDFTKSKKEEKITEKETQNKVIEEVGHKEEQIEDTQLPGQEHIEDFPEFLPPDYTVEKTIPQEEDTQQADEIIIDIEPTEAAVVHQPDLEDSYTNYEYIKDAEIEDMVAFLENEIYELIKNKKTIDKDTIREWLNGQKD